MNKLEKEMNKKILDIWRHNNCKLTKRTPLLYPQLNKKRFIILGLNPGFNKKHMKNYFKDKKSNYKFDELYVFENFFIDQSKKTELISQEYRDSQVEYSKYYEVFKELNVGEKEYIDLFFTRETNSKTLKRHIFINNKNNNGLIFTEDDLTDFAKKQINITKNLLIKLEPMGVLVNSALASHITKNCWKLKEDIKESGVYHIDGKKFPIFLSGMLTGQRALDIYSRRRLFLQIELCLKNRKCRENL